MKNDLAFLVHLSYKNVWRCQPWQFGSRHSRRWNPLKMDETLNITYYSNIQIKIPPNQSLIYEFQALSGTI